MRAFGKPVDLTRISPFFAVLFLIALVAFWPTYLSLSPFASSIYTHIHAVTATLWMVMLISQPFLIRRGRYTLHRSIGRISYVLVPILLVNMVLLANYRIRTVRVEDYPLQTYVLYLQVSLGLLFAISYCLAIFFRHRMELHARFMLCTGLTLIDPVFARLLFLAHPASVTYHHWITFAFTDLLFIAVIWLERKSPSGRWVLPVMLFVFIAGQLPGLFWLTESAIWQDFAKWFAALALT